MNELLGKVKFIGEVQQVTTNFIKRELVVTTEEQYPQSISVNFVKDKCDLLNNYRIGDNVKVGINLRGREWQSPTGETKYFNDIQGWKIEKIENLQSEVPSNDLKEIDFKPAEDFGSNQTIDLPF